MEVINFLLSHTYCKEREVGKKTENIRVNKCKYHNFNYKQKLTFVLLVI